MSIVNATKFLYRHPFVCRYLSRNGSSNVNYCLSMIKKRDYDNYLCTLLLPPALRLPAIAIRALNIELAMIQELTTEPHTARMRIEFWRKNLRDAIDGRPPNHPVLITIALCLENYKDKISASWFNRLIDIRERYMNSRQFMSISDVDEYGDYSVSSILYMLLEANSNNDSDLTHAANHLGKAMSYVTLLRSTSYFREHRKVILPIEILMKHNVSQEDIIKKTNKENIHEVIFDIASQGYNHLRKCNELVVNKRTLNIFLPRVPCEYFYNHIQKLDFNIFDEKLNKRNWFLSFRLLLESWKK